MNSDLAGKGYRHTRLIPKTESDELAFFHCGSRQTWPYLAGLLAFVALGHIAFGSPIEFAKFVQTQPWYLLIFICPSVGLFLIFLWLTIYWFCINHRLVLRKDMKRATISLRSSCLGIPLGRPRQIPLCQPTIYRMYESADSTKKLGTRKSRFVFLVSLGVFQLPGISVILGESEAEARSLQNMLSSQLGTKVRWVPHALLDDIPAAKIKYPRGKG
jgi:hypothetical protein